MTGKDTLGDRMKGYEKVFDHVLPPGDPSDTDPSVILRLDGNSFHKLTSQHFKAPFDDRFKDAMYAAAIAVLDYCRGKLAYVQSDEISVLLVNDPGSVFLRNRIQKMCSIMASACAVRFSKEASRSTGDDIEARFDCRCFPIPRDDVINYFEWRQRDAMKNAVNSIYYWKLRETMGRKAATSNADGVAMELKTLALREHGILIEQYPAHYIRGAVVFKEKIETPVEDVAPSEIIDRYNKHGQMVIRHAWKVDKDIPVFSDRGYLQSLTGTLPPVEGADRPADQ
jgi:tRNA(His) 5'-end guanylyltransferase